MDRNVMPCGPVPGTWRALADGAERRPTYLRRLNSCDAGDGLKPTAPKPAALKPGTQKARRSRRPAHTHGRVSSGDSVLLACARRSRDHGPKRERSPRPAIAQQAMRRACHGIGITFDLSGMPKACPLEGMVRRRGGAHDLNSSEMFTEHTV